MKRKLSPEDLRLWQAQLKDVKPLSKAKKVVEQAPAPQKSPTPPTPPHGLKKIVPSVPSPIPLQAFDKKAPTQN